MTWNVLDGAPGLRLARVVMVVRSARPTVLVLQEANGFDAHRQRKLRVLEAACAMRGFLATARTGYHVAMLVAAGTRVERRATPTSPFHHALLHLHLAFGDGHELDVVGAHLNPRSPAQRLEETRRLCEYASDRDDVAILGDLNTPDHHGDHRAAMAAMAPDDRSRFAVPPGTEHADTRVTQALESAGFVDLGHRFAPGAHTIPTALGVPGARFSRLRIDYIYASPTLAARSNGAEVVRGPLVEGASDHYPMIADFAHP